MVNKIAMNFMSDWVDSDKDVKKRVNEINDLLTQIIFLKSNYRMNVNNLDEFRGSFSALCNKAKHVSLYLDKLRFDKEFS